jgi:hypothetical protein
VGLNLASMSLLQVTDFECKFLKTDVGDNHQLLVKSTLSL